MGLKPGERRHAQIEPAVALLFTPQHGLDEQKVHHAAGRVGDMPHQIDRQLIALATLPDIGKGDDAALAPHHGLSEMRQIFGVEEPERKALFARAALGQPSVGNPAQLRHDSAYLFRRHHLERAALALEPPADVAQILAPAATFERELRQVDASLLAQFEQRHAGIDIQRKAA